MTPGIAGMVMREGANRCCDDGVVCAGSGSGIVSAGGANELNCCEKEERELKVEESSMAE